MAETSLSFFSDSNLFWESLFSSKREKDESMKNEKERQRVLLESFFLEERKVDEEASVGEGDRRRF